MKFTKMINSWINTSLFLLFFMGIKTIGSAQTTFNSLQSLFLYVDKQSISMQSNALKVLQAKQGKLAALLSVPDIQANVNGSFLHNTRLPVSILDASAFGGQTGEVRELTLGTPYQTSFNQSIDIKLINLEGIKNISLSKLNIAISESDALLYKKSLYENITTLYFIIIQLQAQSVSTLKNINVADTLLQITTNKYNEGLAKQQDVNDARVNLLSHKETQRQIQFSITQQYNALKILCDIPEGNSIEIVEDTHQPQALPTFDILTNHLSYKNSLLKERYAYDNLQKVKHAFLPTLSFVGSNSYNVYNQDFKILGGDWINNNYVGLKLNWVLPNASMITHRTNAKYQYLLAQKTTEQAYKQAQNDVAQLENDVRKAISQYSSKKEIWAIQTDTYQKNENLYREGLQSLDKLLISFNNKVNSEYQTISSKVAVDLAYSKIDNHNKFSTYAK